jgi:hypothetical protein
MLDKRYLSACYIVFILMAVIFPNFAPVHAQNRSCVYEFTPTSTSFTAYSGGYGSGSSYTTLCGEAGDIIYIDHDSWRLYDPNGRNLTGRWTQWAGEYTLPSTGIYEIETTFSFTEYRWIEVPVEKMEREGWVTIYEQQPVDMPVQGADPFTVTLLNRRASWATTNTTNNPPNTTSQSSNINTSASQPAAIVAPPRDLDVFDGLQNPVIMLVGVAGVFAIGIGVGLRGRKIKDSPEVQERKKQVLAERAAKKAALEASRPPLVYIAPRAIIYRIIGASLFPIAAFILLVMSDTRNNSIGISVIGTFTILLFSYAINRFIVQKTLTLRNRDNFGRRHLRGVIGGLIIGLITSAIVLGLGDVMELTDNSQYPARFPTFALLFAYFAVVLNISAASAHTRRSRIIKGTMKIAVFNLIVSVSLNYYIQTQVLYGLGSIEIISGEFVELTLIMAGTLSILSLFITLPMWLADWFARPHKQEVSMQ